MTVAVVPEEGDEGEQTQSHQRHEESEDRTVMSSAPPPPITTEQIPSSSPAAQPTEDVAAPSPPPAASPPPLTDDEALTSFPIAKLNKLDELISNPRWVIPVLPGGELEMLLEHSILLCRRGIDTQSEPCQRFFREGLTISFTKIMTDDAVSTWRPDIQQCIFKNCEKLVELVCTKLEDDWFPLLDLLAMVLNPTNKFHIYNANRLNENSPLAPGNSSGDEHAEVFAHSIDCRSPKPWLVELLNLFGRHDGFAKVHARIMSGRKDLSIPLIFALIRPFGMCHEFLTLNTVTKYFLPIVDLIPTYLENMTDEELKKESKNESKYDTISGIVKSLKQLSSVVPGREENSRSLLMFRLKMLLRQLQISNFSGKMSALNEVNKVIAGVAYSSNRYNSHSLDDEDWLTAERMANWIKENDLIKIVLRDALHQPQYVEKLEKIVRFVIKEKALTVSDLDDIWAAQAGKHEAIVKNIHDLLAKLAWDFSAEQLDHLFECFQTSWKTASCKQREKLLELIRRLAEDDKDGMMAEKVLKLFWGLAHSQDVTVELMDQALAAHVKILDYSCTQYRDQQKSRWLDRCVEELKRNDNWVLPALKQIRDICSLYQEAPPSSAHQQRTPGPVAVYRNDVINRLQDTHALVILIADNLKEYMARIRALVAEKPALASVDPAEFSPDGRHSHVAQVAERLHFLRFLLRDGHLWLCAPQAKQIWHCLAENAVFAADREQCFKWFSKLMGEEPDLDPEINRDFFESNLLQLDPSLLTEAGIKCFERFFKAVNVKEGKLALKRRGSYLMEDTDLIGLDYCWKVIQRSPEEVSNKAIELLKEVKTNLGPRLQATQNSIHEDFIASCMDVLKSTYDTVSVLKQGDGGRDDDPKMADLLQKLCRTLKVLYEYIKECDNDYLEERSYLPLYRAARGKQILVVLRYPNTGRQMEDVEIYCHDNDTLATLRRSVFNKLKASPATVRLDLVVGQDTLDPTEDRTVLSKLGIRDKTIITAKLSQVGSGGGGGGASSPDSSSDSSGGSPQHHLYDGPNPEAETSLPGVIMSSQGSQAPFLCNLAELGISLKHNALRNYAFNLLRLLPAEKCVVSGMRECCKEALQRLETAGTDACQKVLEKFFITPSHSMNLYQLEVCHSLVLPASNQTLLSERAHELKVMLMKSGAVKMFLKMLLSNSLQSADKETQKTTYLVVLKLCKFLLTVVAHSLLYMVVDAQRNNSSNQVSDATHNHAVVLQQGIQLGIPCPSESQVRQIALGLGQYLMDKGAHYLPDINVIRSVYRLAWSTAAGDFSLQNAQSHQLREAIQSQAHGESYLGEVGREALEVLTLTVALHPPAPDILTKDKAWQSFMIDTVLLCKDRVVRKSAADQFLYMATKSTSDTQFIKFMVTLLFTVVGSLVPQHQEQSAEYFQLLTRLLSSLAAAVIPLNNMACLLSYQVDALRAARESMEKTGETGISNTMLEGHLALTRELVLFLPNEKKELVGTNGVVALDGTAGNSPTTNNSSGSGGLVRELVEDWIFPASKLWVKYSQTGQIDSHREAVCQTPATTAAAFDLLVALCTGCPKNLVILSKMLSDLFYSRGDSISEWEYLPPVGPRPSGGFVGLKNAGATCYMNSVLQQMFMLDKVKYGILQAEGACVDQNEDFSGEDRLDDETLDGDKEGEEKVDYNVTILKQVQAIFGHLALTQLQYYVPKGLWKHFRMQGEPVNLREQQDAAEFFMKLIESIDDALKSLKQPQICTSVFVFTMSDQKICKTCPHRYSKQEPYSVLAVDLKNHSHLHDSLAEYTKGELLETENAYYCEQCNKKVDTVKRLVVKKLSPILVIQLKRFEYDYERDQAIKFNDYFEFPRELDMEPYTVYGLAKRENEAVDCGPEDLDPNVIRKYNLRGMVVHSGQASGGHYYSYIRQGEKWYKFDDGDVTEVNIQDDEEFKNQCWGGEYTTEIFDHMLKRMTYRRQKRWWNAFMLFYARADLDSLDSDITNKMKEMSLKKMKIPQPIEKSIIKQNVKFLHNRNQFSPEYFNFMKKLISCNAAYVTVSAMEKLSPENEEIALATVQLASAFLFTVGFHTKKSVRGSANDWYELLSAHLRCSKLARAWFCNNVLFAVPSRFSEYLLECPNGEVRQAFARIIVFCAHFSLSDGASPVPVYLQQIPTEVPINSGLSDHLLLSVLFLLWNEVSEYGRHLPQYFNLFATYSSLGSPEKLQLLKLNVPAIFIQVALDDGPGPPIKYQYAELGKLYQVVSNLVRCCDVSTMCQSSVDGGACLPNPFAENVVIQGGTGYLMPIQPLVVEHLFHRTTYLKKLIEEANNTDDTRKLLQFCCWENPHFSHAVLYELLWQIAFAYTYELRPYFHLLLYMLMLEDSWQTHRIHKALKGIVDDHSSRDGLFEIINRSKAHYQKRAYQCIKNLVSLFSQCAAAKVILQANGELKRKWSASVQWLHDELERGVAGPGGQPGRMPGGSYYSNWSPPAASNETANGYFLERSQSARLTLEKACELLPEDEEGGEYGEDEGVIASGHDDRGVIPPPAGGQAVQLGGRLTAGHISGVTNMLEKEQDDEEEEEISVSENDHEDGHNNHNNVFEGEDEVGRQQHQQGRRKGIPGPTLPR